MAHMKLKAIFVADVLVFYFHFLVPASTQNSLYWFWFVRTNRKKLLNRKNFVFLFYCCMGDVRALLHYHFFYSHSQTFSYISFHNIHPKYPYNSDMVISPLLASCIEPQRRKKNSLSACFGFPFIYARVVFCVIMCALKANNI